MQRSPSWQLAEDLAQAMGVFSSLACKKALEKVGNDANAAAMWLLDQGAQLEAELAAEAEAETEGTLEQAESILDEEEADIQIRTVSFRPVADTAVRAMSPELLRTMSRGTSADSISNEHGIDVDEVCALPAAVPASSTSSACGIGSQASGCLSQFISAVPPPAPVLPDEASVVGMVGGEAAPNLLRQMRTKLPEMPPLAIEECLAGRLLRPTPLTANRNCVLAAVDADGLSRLSSRAPETDAMQTTSRHLAQCQRAEAALVAHFPELRHLGANSSGLSSVSGTAHSTLAIMLLRQSVLYLLADVQGLQCSHDDAESAFDLEQLGQPRAILDLIKLGSLDGTSAYTKLWSLLESLMKADNETAQLPGPFRDLPRLLRDDALGHLKRELRGCATLNSPHPIGGSKLQGRHKLQVPGATQLVVQMDSRSQLAGSGHLLFCTDEEGMQPVGRWEGVAANQWRNITVLGDTVWIHTRGEFNAKLAKTLWGFRVRVSSQGWEPPEVELHALEAPLDIGWHLLELLCAQRPLELLTTHTFLILARYLHAADAPHHPLAAALLLRLLKLPASALPAGAPDPRELWPMEQLISLSAHVEWHAQHTVDPVSKLLPLHIQLFAEVVAQAWLRLKQRSESTPPSRPWIEGVVELSTAASFFLAPHSEEGLDPLQRLPHRWLAALQDAGLEVLQLQDSWTLADYAALIKLASATAPPKTELLALSPFGIAAPRRGGGLLAGFSTTGLQVRFGLLGIFNKTLQAQFAFVYTGYSERSYTLGAELCALRELIFPDVKQRVWRRMLESTAPTRDTAWYNAHPPPVVAVNRHRAAKERPGRRARKKHVGERDSHSQPSILCPHAIGTHRSARSGVRRLGVRIPPAAVDFCAAPRAAPGRRRRAAQAARQGIQGQVRGRGCGRLRRAVPRGLHRAVQRVAERSCPPSLPADAQWAAQPRHKPRQV